MHTFADTIARGEATAGGAVATVCGGRRTTFRDLASRCRRLAASLHAMGLERGDRAGLLALNSDRYIETYLAVPAAGLAIVPLNTRHAGPELEHAIADSGMRVLITDRDPAPFEGLVESVVRLPDGYEELIANGADRELPVLTPGDLAGLFYTGGTTGKSKGVMLTHGNLIANTWHWLTASGQRPEDVYLVMAPLFHAAGSNSVLASTWIGARQVVLETFDPGAALDLIASEGVTMTIGVPAMMAAMAEEQLERPRDVASLRFFGHGGAPISTEVVRRTHQAFPGAELVHLYGATETAPLATALRHEERVVDTPLGRSCGQPVAGVRVAVIDERGAELPPGEVGEIAIAGPNIMVGYWNRPDLTDEVLRGGWYRSGDLGRLDETCHVFLVDRAKDMIVSGGENVYSTEVEEALYKHPAVLEAAVFGVPDPQWGEAVHAVVVPRATVTPEALIEHCRALIAGYKIPKAIDLRDELLPKSGPGKVLKRELRAPFWEGRDRDIS